MTYPGADVLSLSFIVWDMAKNRYSGIGKLTMSWGIIESSVQLIWRRAKKYFKKKILLRGPSGRNTHLRESEPNTSGFGQGVGEVRSGLNLHFDYLKPGIGMYECRRRGVRYSMPLPRQ